ncbi:MAG: DUF4258 domain-containing protein [Candidatus Omnitrophota bacterium]
MPNKFFSLSAKQQSIMGKIQGKINTKIAFEIKAELGFLIKTTIAYWNVITQIKHPSIQGKEKQVKETLACPSEIRQSKKDKKVYLFYKKYNSKFLCVVVKIDKKKGFIVTAYYTEKIKEGELKWKK